MRLGLAAIAVDFYLAAHYCLGSERARFEETRGPEPFIEPYFFFVFLIDHTTNFLADLRPRKSRQGTVL